MRRDIPNRGELKLRIKYRAKAYLKIIGKPPADSKYVAR
jgi:hypothetical protein